jgi:hypothetical protein
MMIQLGFARILLKILKQVLYYSGVNCSPMEAIKEYALGIKSERSSDASQTIG